MVEDRADLETRKIIVGGDRLPARVRNGQIRIQRGQQAPRKNFGDDLLSLDSLDFVDFRSARLRNPAFEKDGERRLPGSGKFCGFRRRQIQGRRFQEFIRGGIPLRDANPVDEVGASAVNGVPDQQPVFAVLRNHAGKNGIGIEIVVIGVADAFPFGIKHFQRALEIPRHTVSHERHQGAGLRPENQFFPFLRGEKAGVGLSRHDLAVEDKRDLEAHVFPFFRRNLHEGFSSLGNRSHIKRQGIAQFRIADQPEFTASGGGIRSDSDLQNGQAVDRGAHLKGVPLNENTFREDMKLQRSQFVDLVKIRMFPPLLQLFGVALFFGDLVFSIHDIPHPGDNEISLLAAHRRNSRNQRDRFHRHPFSGHKPLPNPPELLSAQKHFDGFPRFSAGGHQISDMLRGQGGRHKKDTPYQRCFHGLNSGFLYSSLILFLPPSGGRIVRSSPRGFGSFPAGSIPDSS
ncbi:MAG: hypothetical protein BWY31_04722 [Lentisphaerae bacterium ADurb.Bin242]|nr:MAG: hypothetical protein BWY31_04722 [Lentisphaerae bacterium ADurb.Bin242]